MRNALLWIALITVFLLLRNWAGWPRGVDRDENQDCWNARCLATCGSDFLGNRWPLVLEDYGDDKHALYAWLLAGFERLGIEVRPERARVFSACMLAAGALLFGLAFALTTGSSRWGLVACSTLAFLPWFQVGPCLSWECATNPLGYGAMFFGLALTTRGYRGSGAAAFLAGLAFAVYGYPAPKVLSPLLLAAACMLFWETWRARAIVFAIGTALLLPLAIDNLLVEGHRDRAAAILVPDAATFVSNWLSHWLPPFLAYRGDVLPRHFAGFLGVVPIALLVAAMWQIGTSLMRRQWLPSTPLGRFALVCFLVFPLPAALTDDGHDHVLRSLLGGFAVAWCGVAGLRTIGRARPRIALALGVLVAAQCLANHAWLRFEWRDAKATAAEFHGTFYSDLREVAARQRPSRVFFSPLPEIQTSAFPLIMFGWTALGTRPVCGEMHPRVPGHLATEGHPEVDVWMSQPATHGIDLVIQHERAPDPPGFREVGRSDAVRFWIRGGT